MTSWYDYPAAILGRTEGPLLDWFRRNVRPGETWLDIGAHYGYTAIALCELVGESGRVFAFEPMITTAGCIARTRELNGIEQLMIVPMALGEREGFAIQMLPAVRGMIDSTISHKAFQEPILIAALDWLWPRLRQAGLGTSESIAGVKIDVQGMEIKVLRGMVEVLRRWRPKLAIELHQGVSRHEVVNLLAELGYPAQGAPIEPLPGETAPQYADDRSYAFVFGS